MGGTFSTNNVSKNELKPKNMNEIIDYIATYYILTMDFESLKKLNEKTYCDNLVILTSEIIEKYFTSLEITYLAQRIKNGVQVDQTEKDNLVFFSKDDISNLDIGNDTVKKNRVCIGIAKFYVKISHIFAAIVMTVNPVYTYRGPDGTKMDASLYTKKDIPKGVERTIERFNICERRLVSLYNNYTPNKVNPTMCSINKKEGAPQNVKTLNDEPGIPELMELYKDDNYDSGSGKFMGMKPETAKMYKSNLEMFYKVFTNNATMDESIKKFSDIKLRDYHNSEKCITGKYKQNYVDDGINKDSSRLFSEYASNLKKMLSNTNKNQNELMDILNRIFVYTINPNTKKKQIRISPKLTENELGLIVLKTRKIIINLYMTCEQDYLRGLNIYEAIVNQKFLDTNISQVKTYEMEKQKLNQAIITEQKVEIPEVNAEKIMKEKIIYNEEQKIEHMRKTMEEEYEDKVEEIRENLTEESLITKNNENKTNVLPNVLPNVVPNVVPNVLPNVLPNVVPNIGTGTNVLPNIGTGPNVLPKVSSN